MVRGSRLPSLPPVLLLGSSLPTVWFALLTTRAPLTSPGLMLGRARSGRSGMACGLRGATL
eukprot:7052896-Alexandrium_andersonii.AAC.1